MNISAHNHSASELEWKYRENFARHILSVSLYLQSEIMDALTLKHGHDQLRINYEPYISIAAQGGARLSDIAELLGISRQAANQSANQIVKAGYLKRADDPRDGRAKLLVITPRAKAIIKHGSAEALNIQKRFARITGDQALDQASADLVALNRKLGLLFPFQDGATQLLAATLPRLSDYIANRLQVLTMAKGHAHLKRSFGAVLTSIGPQGGRIQQIASAHDVSKQAISAIASELEALGYLRRESTCSDTRQVLLQFTEAGRKLIADSVASVDQLADELTEKIGKTALQHIVDVMAAIYRSLHLEKDVFEPAGSTNMGTDIRILARQIIRQLGAQDAKALARLILADEHEL